MISKILPDFQEFLTSHALVDKKYAPFYARWVSKFLAFSDKDGNLGFTERKEKFLFKTLSPLGLSRPRNNDPLLP